MSDPRSNYEKMVAGDLYIADDQRILAEQQRAARLMADFNEAYARNSITAQLIVAKLFRHVGEDAFIRAPVFVDFGHNISVGPRTFINFNLTALDVAPIVIGADCQIATNVQLLTPTHPLDADLRRQRYESAEAITIGDNVWLGGGVIVCPGVTIGNNCVIGAGSVVTRDVPPDSLAVGSPARVVRNLAERTRD